MEKIHHFSYLELVNYLKSLHTSSDRRNMFEELESEIKNSGFGKTSMNVKFAYAWLIKEDPARIPEIKAVSPDTKEKLYALQNTQRLTITRILTNMFMENILAGQFNIYKDIQRFKNAPVVLFLVPPNGNALKGNTIGLYHRKRKGAYPPTGVYHAAAVLDLLGIVTYVFDLDLDGEYEHFVDILNKHRDNLYFISMTSRFMAQGEYELLSSIRKEIESVYPDRKQKPFILGGGIGPVLSMNEPLEYGYLDAIVCGISPYTLPEMILDSDFFGIRTPERDFHKLFAHVTNLAYYSSASKKIHMTCKEKSDDQTRLLVAETYNIAKIPYESRYWPGKYAIAICSPDDLNISITQNIDTKELGKFELHPSNYLFKPNMARFLSVIGNCPRNCKFCHWHTFDSSRYVIPYDRLIAQLENAYINCPSLEMIGWLDEDFLVCKPDIQDFLDLYKNSSLYPRVKQSLETLPQYISESLLEKLWDANFKAIYLGYESPVERILLDIRKLRKNESYEFFRKAPYICYDAGFVTRCSTITFYPLITENELAVTIDEILNMINYGISIEVNPYVIAVPGSEISNSHEFTAVKNEYVLGNNHHMEFYGEVLPIDEEIKQIAKISLEKLPGQIVKVKNQFKLENDFDMSFGVLAYLISIIESWDAVLPNRNQTAVLKEKANNTLQNLYIRHTDFLFLQKCIKELKYDKGQLNEACSLFEQRNNSGKLWYCLRMFMDFGDTEECIAALTISEFLHRNGFFDTNASRSEKILIDHPVYDIAARAYDAYNMNNCQAKG